MVFVHSPQYIGSRTLHNSHEYMVSLIPVEHCLQYSDNSSHLTHFLNTFPSICVFNNSIF